MGGWGVKGEGEAEPTLAADMLARKGCPIPQRLTHCFLWGFASLSLSLELLSETQWWNPPQKPLFGCLSTTFYHQLLLLSNDHDLIHFPEHIFCQNKDKLLRISEREPERRATQPPLPLSETKLASWVLRHQSRATLTQVHCQTSPNRYHGGGHRNVITHIYTSPDTYSHR